jgi:hypothetical protein
MRRWGACGSLQPLMGNCRRVLRSTALAACAAALVTGEGCGHGSNAASEIRSTLERFANAVTRHDYGVLCNDLLSVDLTARLARIGLPCEQAMARGLGSVKRPALTILSVRVQGSKANAVIRTSASNQAPSEDTIELVRSGDQWRIASLGSASS